MSADDFRELAMASVEAVSVGDADQRNGMVPGWCEILLTIERDSNTALKLPFTRHDCELIIEVLWEVLHPQSHRNAPATRLWEKLDEVMEYLMVDDPEEEDKASARSLALAIALITQPWSEEPDVARVRAEAVERWELRQ